jgi:hypothetical protein
MCSNALEPAEAVQSGAAVSRDANEAAQQAGSGAVAFETRQTAFGCRRADRFKLIS